MAKALHDQRSLFLISFIDVESEDSFMIKEQRTPWGRMTISVKYRQILRALEVAERASEVTGRATEAAGRAGRA